MPPPWKPNLPFPNQGGKDKGKGKGDPKEPPLPEFIIGPDGKTYRIDYNSGMVYNEAGQVVAGARYDGSTGEFSLPGYPVMDLDKELGPPTPGETYDRDFTGKNWMQVSFEGKIYFVQKKTNRAYEVTAGKGRYVGEWLPDENLLSLFDLPPAPGEEEPEEPEEPGEEGPTAEQEDSLKLLQDFLGGWGFGPEAASWAWNAIIEGWSQDRILLELRQTDFYNVVFPEVKMRKDAGLIFMSEIEILNYRNEAKRLGKQLLGIDIATSSISNIIGNNWSLGELEHRLQVAVIARDNPGMRAVLEAESERKLSDLEFQQFLDPEWNTSEFDDAYNDARYKATAYNLQFGLRSDEEVDFLRNVLGLSDVQAGQRYLAVADARPMFERLAAIDSGVTGAQVFANTTLEELIQGFVMEDPATKARLNAQLAREGARWAPQGGAALAQTGQAVGLLTPEQRRKL